MKFLIGDKFETCDAIVTIINASNNLYTYSHEEKIDFGQTHIYQSLITPFHMTAKKYNWIHTPISPVFFDETLFIL